ncbi:MAG: TIGR04086 family membrane protein [Clostridia bacterium]|jgi:putative membrane protein (TIGR04086 family)|nr:TIGR04086 family membrane protein [Clostridia bacterium]
MKSSLKNSPSYEGFKLSAVIKGLIIALVLTLILCILVSLVFQFTPLSESLLDNFSAFIFFISMLAGSLLTAYAAGGKGLQHGLAVSGLYLLVILAMGLIWDPLSFTLLHIAKRAGLALLSGVLGGFIGIGLATK